MYFPYHGNKKKLDFNKPPFFSANLISSATSTKVDEICVAMRSALTCWPSIKSVMRLSIGSPVRGVQEDRIFCQKFPPRRGNTPRRSAQFARSYPQLRNS